MGIIKIKNANEEQAKNIAIDEQPVYGVDVEVNENTDIPQENQEQCQDPAVLYEDESRTDKHTRHYVMNNGTVKSVFNAESVSYFDEEAKKWKPIDNSLKENADAYESKNGNMRTKIYKENKGKKVEIAKSDKQLSWEYLGKQVETVSVANENVETFSASVLKVNNDLAGESANINSSAVYENIEKDTDLEYCLLGNNLKENIIVREKSADYRYLFALKTEGLKIRLSEDNESLELYTERTNDDGTVEQKVEFTIPAPFMYDANGESSDDVYYELEPSENGNYAFAVVASDEWINAAERAFPVTIDPQIVTDNSSLITKQVQYRVVSTGLGSGSSTGSWTNTSSSDIRVYKSNSIEYRTCLTIKRSLMNLPNNRIVGVKLIMSPSSNFEGYLIVNNTYKHYKSSDGKLEQDITGIFKRYTSDFTINIEPSYYPYEYINGYFSMSANPPVIEVEYLTNENTKPVKKIFSLAGVAAANVNLATGDMVTSFCDIDGDRSVKGVEIKHVYKKDGANFFCGNNFRLNIQEKFVKNSSGVLDANYIYTDADGDKHGFRDYYYYIDQNGKKNYISSKSSIVVEADGTLKYNGYNVACEYKSASGLKAITVLEGLKNVKSLDQRSDKIKELSEQVKTYGNAWRDFVIINLTTGEIENSNLSETVIFDTYTQTMMPIPKSEALQYKSLKDQLANLIEKSSSDSVVGNNEYKSVAALKNSIDSENEELNDYIKGTDLEKNSQISSKLNSYTEIIPISVFDNVSSDSKYSKNGNQITLKQLIRLFRQRNLSIEQYNDQITLISTQDDTINNQLSLISKKRTVYIEQIQGYYKEYKAKLEELKQAKLQTPVNFLTDGKIYKGYNESGNLVAIFDAYENNVVIEYEQYYIEYASGERITRICDNDNNVVTFSYTPDNKLSCITDRNGRNTRYVYDSGSNLKEVIFDTGEKINITYYGNFITSIAEEKNNLYAKVLYNGSKLSAIINGSSVDTDIDTVYFSFVQNNNSTMNYVTITTDKSKERYYFNADNNLKEYRLEEGGVMSKAEQYVYNPYWKGSTKQSDPKVVTTSTTKESLRGKTLTNFVFTAGDTETTTLDQFENPLKTTNSRVKLDAGGTNYLTVVTDRLYDDNQKLIEEVTTGTYSKDNKSLISHTKYNYNYAGNIVRKETYVEGEEFTKGKTVEETVYDNKGNVTKAFTYNTLDSSSKFYSSESEYDETGKTLADYDETGENKTKYGYKDGTSVVRETILPNGSKFAYGHDADDTVTSITQSTEDGEENSTQKVYKYGQVIEVKSGNTTVGYEYDDKRRLSEVKLNGNAHSTFEYHENETLNGVTVDRVVEKKDGKEFTTYTDKRGRVIRAGFPEKVQIDYGYNAAGNVESMTETVDNISVRSFAYTYNGLDKLTSYTEKDHGTDKHKETYAYDDYGKLTEVKHDSGFTYRYGYKSSTDGEIDNISIGENIVVKPKTDVNGRNTGKQVLFANTQVETESISYVKFGDHATNLPSSIVFGKKGVINCSASERLKYSYDKMGNISAIFKNGTLIVKYTYDKLNRIIREDNRTLKHTWVFAYDNNGNIITKKETDFTLKENTEDCVFTEHLYEYDGDELVYYDGKTCCYMAKTGKPSIYKNNNVYWSGVNVVEYGNNTFTYDACGRRLTKNNLVYTYDSNGKLIRQSNGLEFFYDHTGVAGMKYNGTTYIYRKDVQGNIIALLDSNGRIVVKYAYDAWGNYAAKALDRVDGKVQFNNADPDTVFNADYEKYKQLANINPFRYRGYYYDTETELYFLKTRYYDPEVGRFISPDSIEYLDPETINGLNLYAYCNNNPVSNVDPNGNKWWHWLIGVLIVVASVALSVVTAGIAAPITAALGSGLLGAIVGGAVAGAIGGAITAFGISVATQGIKTGFTNIDWKQVGIQTAIGALSGAVLGGIGGGIKYARAAHYLKSNGVATDPKEILRNFKGIPSVKTSNGTIGFRYFDNINAMSKGKWLTSALTNNPIRDLVLYNNNATMVSKFMIEKGAQYLVGTIAKSPVNAIQYFVANVNWLSLL